MSNVNNGPSAAVSNNMQAGLQAHIATGVTTFANLPPASRHGPEGTNYQTAWTSDQGLVYSNGTAWVGLATASNTPFSPSAAGLPAGVGANVQAALTESLARTITGNVHLNASSMPLNPAHSTVQVDIGIASLKPKNLWSSLPSGFSYTSGTGSSISDTTGLTPGSAGGRVQNSSAFPAQAMTTGSIYLRVARGAIAADNSQNSGSTFYDSTGNTTGGSGSSRAVLAQCVDGLGALLEIWKDAGGAMGVRAVRSGTSTYFPTGANLNSNRSTTNGGSFMEIVITWSTAQLYCYVDGVLIGDGTMAGAMVTGMLTYISLGCAVNGNGGNGVGLGAFAIQRFQLSTTYCGPQINSLPKVGFYGDSYVVGGFNIDSSGYSTPPTAAQVLTSQKATSISTYASMVGTGPMGQNQWGTILEGYAWDQFGTYIPAYVAAQTGHGWATSGMTNAGTPATTPGIDDFSGTPKLGIIDALCLYRPEIVVAFGSVNDVSNASVGAKSTDMVGDMQARFDYMANQNPALREIIYFETFSCELSTSGTTAFGGQAGWTAEMTRLRTLVRAAFYSTQAYAGTRQVPITFVPTYETWVQGTDARRYIIATNPDNNTTTADGGGATDIHPCQEGQIKIADFVWTALKPRLSARIR